MCREDENGGAEQAQLFEIVIVPPKRGSGGGSLPGVSVPGGSVPEGSGAGVSDAALADGVRVAAAGVKWKKVTKKVLEAGGGRMKLGKLQRKVLEAAGLAGHSSCTELGQLAEAQWRKSSQFLVEGKYVVLVA